MKPVITSRIPRVVRLTRSGESSGGYLVAPHAWLSSFTVMARYFSWGAEARE